MRVIVAGILLCVGWGEYVSGTRLESPPDPQSPPDPHSDRAAESDTSDVLSPTKLDALILATLATQTGAAPAFATVLHSDAARYFTLSADQGVAGVEPGHELRENIERDLCRFYDKLQVDESVAVWGKKALANLRLALSTLKKAQKQEMLEQELRPGGGLSVCMQHLHNTLEYWTELNERSEEIELGQIVLELVWRNPRLEPQIMQVYNGRLKLRNARDALVAWIARQKLEQTSKTEIKTQEYADLAFKTEIKAQERLVQICDDALQQTKKKMINVAMKVGYATVELSCQRSSILDLHKALEKELNILAQTQLPESLGETPAVQNPAQLQFDTHGRKPEEIIMSRKLWEMLELPGPSYKTHITLQDLLTRGCGAFQKLLIIPSQTRQIDKKWLENLGVSEEDLNFYAWNINAHLDVVYHIQQTLKQSRRRTIGTQPGDIGSLLTSVLTNGDQLLKHTRGVYTASISVRIKLNKLDKLIKTRITDAERIMRLMDAPEQYAEAEIEAIIKSLSIIPDLSGETAAKPAALATADPVSGKAPAPYAAYMRQGQKSRESHEETLCAPQRSLAPKQPVSPAEKQKQLELLASSLSNIKAALEPKQYNPQQMQHNLQESLRKRMEKLIDARQIDAALDQKRQRVSIADMSSGFLLQDLAQARTRKEWSRCFGQGSEFSAIRIGIHRELQFLTELYKELNRIKMERAMLDLLLHNPESANQVGHTLQVWNTLDEVRTKLVPLIIEHKLNVDPQPEELAHVDPQPEELAQVRLDKVADFKKRAKLEYPILRPAQLSAIGKQTQPQKRKRLARESEAQLLPLERKALKVAKITGYIKDDFSFTTTLLLDLPDRLNEALDETRQEAPRQQAWIHYALQEQQALVRDMLQKLQALEHDMWQEANRDPQPDGTTDSGSSDVPSCVVSALQRPNFDSKHDSSTTPSSSSVSLVGAEATHDDTSELPESVVPSGCGSRLGQEEQQKLGAEDDMHQKRQTLSEMHQKRQTLSEMHNMLQQLQKLKHLLQEQQTLSDVYNTLQKLQEPDAGCDTQRELKLKLKQTHDTLQELQTRAHETLQAQRELCGKCDMLQAQRELCGKCDMLRAQQELVCDMLQEQQKLGEGYDLLQGLLNETQLFIQSSPDQIYRSNFETVQRWLKSLEPLKERLEQMLGAGQSKLQAIESEQLHASDSEQPGQSPYERLMKNKLQQRADIIVRMNKLTNRLLTSVCEVMFRLNPVQERRLRGMEQKDKIQKKQQRLLAVTIAGERAVRKAVETVESQMEYPVNMDFGDVSQLLVRSISGSLTLLQIDKAGHVYF